MSAWKLFKPKACSVGLKASEKVEVLAEIAETMVKGGALDVGSQSRVFDALVAREKTASTGVGQGVAIPHVQIVGLDQVAFSLCVHPQGVDWDAVDGAPVQVFFTVLRPDKPTSLYDPTKHLELMRWIARLARTPDFRRFAVQAKTRTELVDLLKEMADV